MGHFRQGLDGGQVRARGVAWSGTIPKELGDLRDLVGLHLSNNRLTGKIFSRKVRFTPFGGLESSAYTSDASPRDVRRATMLLAAFPWLAVICAGGVSLLLCPFAGDGGRPFPLDTYPKLS